MYPAYTLNTSRTASGHWNVFFLLVVVPMLLVLVHQRELTMLLLYSVCVRQRRARLWLGLGRREVGQCPGQEDGRTVNVRSGVYTLFYVIVVTLETKTASKLHLHPYCEWLKFVFSMILIPPANFQCLVFRWCFGFRCTECLTRGSFYWLWITHRDM